MTRIIAGRAGGRRLKVPAGQTTRPTSDRVREALFSTIEASIGSLDGVRFLDLYAGSGAVGLEAWSRGAGFVTLVEHDRRTAALARANAATIGCRDADVVGAAVSAWLGRPDQSGRAGRPGRPGDTGAGYDVVFLDPPYPLPQDDLREVLARLASGHWLADGALVVVERSARTPDPPWPPGLTVDRRRRGYGETALHYAWLDDRLDDGPDEQG